MTDKAEKPVLLTVREVSHLLRVQRPKVYELIKDGAVDGFKVGADWRIRRDSVERLIGAIPEGFWGELHDEADEAHEQQDSTFHAATVKSAVLP